MINAVVVGVGVRGVGGIGMGLGRGERQEGMIICPEEPKLC